MVSLSFFTHCITFIQKPHHFQGSSVFAEHGSSWIKCGTLSYLLWLYFYIPVSRWKSWIIHYCIRPVIDSDQNSNAKRDPIQWALVDGGRDAATCLEKYLNDYLYSRAIQVLADTKILKSSKIQHALFNFLCYSQKEGAQKNTSKKNRIM